CLDGAREAPPGAAPRKGAPRSPSYRRLAPVFVSLVVLGMLFANVQIALAVAGYRAAQDDFARAPSAGVAAYAAVFRRFSPYHGKEKLNCAYMIINALLAGRPFADPPAAAALALRLADEAEAEHPVDVAPHMVLNDLYNSLALYGDPRVPEQAGPRSAKRSSWATGSRTRGKRKRSVRSSVSASSPT